MRAYSDQKGFTLVEVFAAIAVFAFGILALYRLQASAVNGNSYANDFTQATVLCENKMEQLMALNSADPALADVDGDGTGQDLNSDGIDDDGGNFGLDDTVGGGTAAADGVATSGKFNIYWNIAVDQPIANTRTIRVIVTWLDPKNAMHRTFLTSTKVNTM